MRPKTASWKASFYWALLSVCLATHVEANCEAGAYKIHTLARYLDDSSRLWFFRYDYQGRSLRLAPVSTLSNAGLEELFQRMYGGELTLSDGTASCRPPWKMEGDVSMVTTLFPEVTRLVLFSCFDQPHVPRMGYAFYDRDNKQLRLGKSLRIDPAPKRVAAQESAERWIQANLFKLGLHAQEQSDSPIRPEDVQEVTFGHRAIGESGFTVTIAVLQLRNLDRLFSDSRPAEELQDRFADFPVLFVLRPGKEPLYIGDGSWCSSYRLHTIPGEGRQLGPLERFEVSAAYDLRGQGTPDLLVVNDSIAYFFSPQSDLFVIDYPPGE